MQRLTNILAVPCFLALCWCGGSTTSSGSNPTGGGAGSSGVGGGGGSSIVPCGKLVCTGGDVCCNSSCGICAKPNGACPAIACVDTLPPMGDCNMVPAAPVLRSCVQALGEPVPPPTYGQPTDLSVHGTVMSVGSGALEGGCMESLLRLEAGAPELAAQTKSLVVNDGNKSWVVEYLIPGAPTPALSGTVVDVQYHYQFGGFGPTERWLNVSSMSGPSVYQADAGDIQDLKTPLSLTRGSTICSTQDTCGDWQRYDLVANGGDLSVAIPHGGKAQVGDYLVVHGGYAEQTSPNTQCPDWFVADVHVGIVRVK